VCVHSIHTRGLTGNMLEYGRGGRKDHCCYLIAASGVGLFAYRRNKEQGLHGYFEHGVVCVCVRAFMIPALIKCSSSGALCVVQKD
jgi:hypothetical protein